LLAVEQVVEAVHQHNMVVVEVVLVDLELVLVTQ